MQELTHHVDRLEILSDPNRYLEMRITPPLSGAAGRQYLEDEIRREIRRLNAEVGVVIFPGKVANLAVLIDLQPDLLNDSREKLLGLVRTIFGSRDNPGSKNSTQRKRVSSRIRQALVSGTDDSLLHHTLSCRDLTVTGERKPLKIRIVHDDSLAASQHTLVGISRDSKIKLQLKNSSGRCFWATLKVGNFEVAELNSVLDKIYPKQTVTVHLSGDDSGGHEIQADDFVASLFNGNG